MQKRKNKNSEDSEEVLNQPEDVLRPSVVDQREEQEQSKLEKSDSQTEQQTNKIPKINIHIN